MTTSTDDWINQQIDLRIASALLLMGGVPDEMRQAGAVMMLLSEPAEGSSQQVMDQWERTCDRCGRHCPDDAEFYTGHGQRSVQGVNFIITFAVCGECKKR